MPEAADNSQAPNTRYVVRLFVAGNAPNSRLARNNLEQLRERLNGREIVVQEIDVNQEPEKALEYGVFVTPALQVVEPAPGGIVYGNLSDRKVVRQLFRDDTT